MKETIYIRLKQRIKVSPNKTLTLKDLTKISTTNEKWKESLYNLPFYEVSEKDQNYLVIDVMSVIEKIQVQLPQVDIQTIGANLVLVEVVYPKKSMTSVNFLIVWLLLFIGSALTIMNFHEDVSMRAVHQSIYKMITGIDNEKPLLLQIPYSFGLGAGMILFFNHLFKKKFNEEPSPLEVEMFKYQQDLDQYVVLKEKQESRGESDNN